MGNKGCYVIKFDLHLSASTFTDGPLHYFSEQSSVFSTLQIRITDLNTIVFSFFLYLFFFSRKSQIFGTHFDLLTSDSFDTD